VDHVDAEDRVGCVEGPIVVARIERQWRAKIGETER